MSNWLWLIAVPPWIFFWVTMMAGYFKVTEHYGLEWRWWHMPGWMAYGMTCLVPLVGGIVFAITRFLP